MLSAARQETADLLRSENDDLYAAFDAEFVSCYWPGGDGLTSMMPCAVCATQESSRSIT